MEAAAQLDEELSNQIPCTDSLLSDLVAQMLDSGCQIADELYKSVGLLILLLYAQSKVCQISIMVICSSPCKASIS